MPPENEENKRRIKKLLDSEAETRAETPIEPKVDEQGTTKASAAKKTPPPYFDPADTLLFGDENSEPRHIPLDENNMPLPRRVNEVDMDGTRVSPVAYDLSAAMDNRQLSARSRQAGQIGLLDQLLVDRQSLDAERDLNDALADYHTTRIELEQAAGLPQEGNTP